MTCQAISELSSVSDYLVFPISCDYFFWLKILFAIMFIIAWTIFKMEEEKLGKGDFLSALAVSSLAFTVLAGFGTLIKNSSGIPMIQTDIMMYLLAITIPLNLMWLFKKK